MIRQRPLKQRMQKQRPLKHLLFLIYHPDVIKIITHIVQHMLKKYDQQKNFFNK